MNHPHTSFNQVDYLIIGQGISGTFLSYFLLTQGKKVLVIDNNSPTAASRVASGVINPVTGRRVVRTWMIEELLAFDIPAYYAIEKLLNQPIIRQCNTLSFHPTPQMMDAFTERIPNDHEYLSSFADEASMYPFFEARYGISVIQPCWLIHLPVLLPAWRQQLQNQQALLEETYDHTQLQIHENHVSYKNNTAKKILFCDGVSASYYPFFEKLPFAPNKGEALIVRIKGLPDNYIYKQGITIVPWKDDLFWIGSSYEWKYNDTNPTQSFLERTKTQLNFWLKLPYEILHHLASERPANLERRPFVGLHPQHPQIGILNGMGTKGCSLAPYFANELANHLVHQTPISPTASIERFKQTLARQN